MDLKALNQLPSVAPRHRRKRIGRGPGSGNGKTAGRGHKGAGQRSGHKRRDYYEGGNLPLVRRFPKRGFSNHKFKIHYVTVNVGDLNRFADGAEVDIEALRQHGLAKQDRDGLKVLGDGPLERTGLKVTAHRFSKQAKEKLLAAGATLNELTPPAKRKRTRAEFEAYDRARKPAEAAAGRKKSKGDDDEA